MAGLRKIDNVMYRVSDLNQAAKFYEDVLGLRRLWVDSDAGQIGFAFPEGDSEIVIHTDPEIPNPDFSFQVDDVVSYCEEYKQQGHTVIKEPFEVRCGWFAILEDPYENVISIVDLTRFTGAD